MRPLVEATGAQLKFLLAAREARASSVQMSSAAIDFDERKVFGTVTLIEHFRLTEAPGPEAQDILRALRKRLLHLIVRRPPRDDAIDVDERKVVCPEISSSTSG